MEIHRVKDVVIRFGDLRKHGCFVWGKSIYIKKNIGFNGRYYAYDLLNGIACPAIRSDTEVVAVGKQFQDMIQKFIQEKQEFYKKN